VVLYYVCFLVVYMCICWYFYVCWFWLVLLVMMIVIVIVVISFVVYLALKLISGLWPCCSSSFVFLCGTRFLLHSDTSIID